ncbi:MAG: replicative DNA helicase [Bifidobacteriaceae bacterium]|jgi:replicative DNA helicase|nr:replicative DNA helicase [Bifidobacteriaceae bacterium]
MSQATEFDVLSDLDEFDRVPPHDLAAEQSVLGGMLMSKDAIADVVEVLHEDDFYRPAHETVFNVITSLYGSGEPVDALTVSAELTRRGELSRVGGATYLHDLVQTVPTAANAGYYAQIVRDRAILRRLVEAGTRITQLGYSTAGDDVEDLVNSAQAEVYAVTEREGSEDYQPLSQIIDPFMNDLVHARDNRSELVGVPTGFPALDNLTNGLQPGQLIILAARPGKGKSTLALDFARAAAIKHHLTSVIFSLEMSRTEITQRLVSAESGVLLSKLRNGGFDDHDLERIVARLDDIKAAPLYVDDSPNMSLMEIRAKCRRLKQRHDLKLVIVDYLQLMSSGRKVESRQQEVSEFSRTLKLLAKELSVPVVALSQLNRGPEQRQDKKPVLSDLRESGSLEQDADVVILLHKPDAPAEEGAPMAADEAQLIVAKHRNGPTAEIPVLFRGHVAQFNEPGSDF